MDPQNNADHPYQHTLNQDIIDDFKMVIHNQPDSQSQHNGDEEISQEEFLDRVENILDPHQNNPTNLVENQLRRQVGDLEKKCAELVLANDCLVKNLEELKNNDCKLSAGHQLTPAVKDDSYCAEDISQIQHDFSEIQEVLTSYRQELSQYQQIIQRQKKKYSQHQQKLKNDIIILKEETATLAKTLNEQKIHNKRLQKKNQQLIIELQYLSHQHEDLLIWKQQQQHQQENRPSFFSYPEYENRGDEFMMGQMEKMIEKLAEELEYERKIRKKISDEVKRLSLQLKKQEKKIQKKNQEIFRLEKDIIELKKHIISQKSKMHQKKQIIKSRKGHIRSGSYASLMSNSRRQSGFLQPILRQESPQSTRDQKLRRSSKDDKLSIPGNSLGKVSLRKASLRYQDHHEEQRQLKSSEAINRRMTTDFSQSTWNKNYGIKVIPQIVQDGSGVVLQKLLTQYIFPEQTLLIICSNILSLYDEIQTKKQARQKMLQNTLLVYDFSQKKQTSLKLKPIYCPNTTPLSRDQFFWSTLDLIQRLLSGKPIMKNNPHLMRLIRDLRISSTPMKVSKFTHLKQAFDGVLDQYRKNIEIQD